MNPVELHLLDGRSAGVWACGKCRHVHSTLDAACRCCDHRCRTCGVETPRYWTICTDCRTAKLKSEWAEREAKAAKIEQWDGWVYAEGCGWNDGYFESLEHLTEWLEDDDSGSDRPEYVFTCVVIPFRKYDVAHIIEAVCEELYDDAADDLAGVPELSAAIDAFNAANSHLVTYSPNWNLMVKVPK